MTRTTMGIDLGGCMSGNSAYALIEWTDNKGRIIELFKEPKHKGHDECSAFLNNAVTQYDYDALAVDAPFSLPKPLLDPTFKPPRREGTGEIINPYLYRYTDYWLFKNYALRPMPPAGDRIGRLTARMIEMLQGFDYKPPFINLPQGKKAIYEVYPKQIAFSLGYIEYKASPQNLLKQFGLQEIHDEHLVDAILASFAASEILNGNTITPLSEANDEGWCYPLGKSV